MIHLYALADHPARLPDADKLVALQIDGIDAVLRTEEARERNTTEHEILRHAEVVEQIAKLNDAVLPARLGPPYESDSDVRDAVQQRVPKLREALERVRGCTEMGLRVLQDGARVETSSASGTEYMRARLERVGEAQRVGAELADAVQALVRETKKQVLASPELVLTAAFLVPRNGVPAFRAAIDGMQARRRDLTFVCTGPWPPYSFAIVGGASVE